jgi:hypothetical protein
LGWPGRWRRWDDGSREEEVSTSRFDGVKLELVVSLTYFFCFIDLLLHGIPIIDVCPDPNNEALLVAVQVSCSARFRFPLQVFKIITSWVVLIISPASSLIDTLVACCLVIHRDRPLGLQSLSPRDNRLFDIFSPIEIVPIHNEVQMNGVIRKGFRSRRHKLEYKDCAGIFFHVDPAKTTLS